MPLRHAAVRAASPSTPPTTDTDTATAEVAALVTGPARSGATGLRGPRLPTWARFGVLLTAAAAATGGASVAAASAPSLTASGDQVVAPSSHAGHGAMPAGSMGGLTRPTARQAAGAVGEDPSAGAATAGGHGVFKVLCTFSHRAKDDPIIFPGQPGRSHLHEFFGNATTAAGSTTTSLLRGGTTCENKQDRSAYWVPALYQSGRYVLPDQVQVYYRGSNNDPRSIQPLPVGLRMVAGDAFSTKPQAVGVAAWNCGKVANFRSTIPTCEPGQYLRVRIRFPECWNGSSLDSADHRSHLAYLVKGRCPAGYPVALPRIDIEAHYGAIRGGKAVTLASGSWTSAHGDVFNAFDVATQGALIRRCLVGRIDCGRV